MRSWLIIAFALSPLAAQVGPPPPPPPPVTDPAPGLFTSLAFKNAQQTVLAQYHSGYSGASSGDNGLLALQPGVSVDNEGNALSGGTTIWPFGGPVALGAIEYMYGPNGTRTVFGSTGGSCTQNGMVVTNDFVTISTVWFNPVANAYYALTTHYVQNISVTVANFCTAPAGEITPAARWTLALIRINPGGFPFQ